MASCLSLATLELIASSCEADRRPLLFLPTVAISVPAIAADDYGSVVGRMPRPSARSCLSFPRLKPTAFLFRHIHYLCGRSHTVIATHTSINTRLLLLPLFPLNFVIMFVMLLVPLLRRSTREETPPACRIWT